MVRTVEIVAGVTVGDFASTAALALQNNNAQITNTTATTITRPRFSASLETHHHILLLGLSGCEKFSTTEIEHARKDIGRENLDLGVVVHHIGVVETA